MAVSTGPILWTARPPDVDHAAVFASFERAANVSLIATFAPQLNGKPLALQQYETSFSLAIAPDGERFVLGTDWSLHQFDRGGDEVWRIKVPGIVCGVDVTGDGRMAVAAYGGARLWFARIAEQKPMVLAWAGSHIALAWSPDGKFLMSSMQENQLHGWRVADEKNMRMGGYPAKVKSLGFMSKGQFLATSGAQGVVIFTIGFEADEPGAVPAMADCASSPSHFYRVEGLQISSAFTSIASQIKALRLVQ